MMGVQQVFFRHHRHQLHLDVERRLADRQAGAVADAENVGVDRDGRLAESDIEHDIRGLAPDAGQRFQRVAVMRNLPAVLGDELLRQRDHVLRLGAVEADGLDQVAHPRLAERDHLLRRIGEREQGRRRFVDAGIGRLRGQHDSDQERERIDGRKLGARVRIGGGKAAERLLDLGGGPLRQLGRSSLRVGLAPRLGGLEPCGFALAGGL